MREIMRPIGLAEPVKVQPKPIGKFCASPDCSKRAADGRRFCRRHAAELDAIKEALSVEGQNMSRQGAGDPSGRYKDSKKRKSYPRCCLIGCDNPRIPPATHCIEHEGEEIE